MVPVFERLIYPFWKQKEFAYTQEQYEKVHGQEP